MKKHKLSVLLIALLSVAWINTGFAQYDDLYYNPDTDGDYYYSSSSNDDGNQGNNYNDDEYDEESYEYDDYNYHYSSRIRRFHRPYYGFSYFDPVYVDMAYYDPFWSPGLTTLLIYDDFWSYRSWRRWNRWNYGFGGNPWNGPGAWSSFGSPWRNRWNDPWYGGGGFGNTYVVNNYYGGGFGNSFNGPGNYSSYYCPPSWGSGFTYNTVANVNNNYYGARRTGVRPESGPGSLRLGTPGSIRNEREAAANERQSLAAPRTGSDANSASERDAIRRELNESRYGSSADENSRGNSRSSESAAPSRNTERNAGSGLNNNSGRNNGSSRYDSPSSGSRERSSGSDYNNSRSKGSSFDSPGNNNSRSNNWNSGSSRGSFDSGSSRNSGSFNSGGSSRGSSGGGSAPRSSSGGSSRGGGRG